MTATANSSFVFLLSALVCMSWGRTIVSHVDSLPIEAERTEGNSKYVDNRLAVEAESSNFDQKLNEKSTGFPSESLDRRTAASEMTQDFKRFYSIGRSRKRRQMTDFESSGLVKTTAATEGSLNSKTTESVFFKPDKELISNMTGGGSGIPSLGSAKPVLPPAGATGASVTQTSVTAASGIPVLVTQIAEATKPSTAAATATSVQPVTHLPVPIQGGAVNETIQKPAVPVPATPNTDIFEGTTKLPPPTELSVTQNGQKETTTEQQPSKTDTEENSDEEDLESLIDSLVGLDIAETDLTELYDSLKKNDELFSCLIEIVLGELGGALISSTGPAESWQNCIRSVYGSTMPSSKVNSDLFRWVLDVAADVNKKSSSSEETGNSEDLLDSLLYSL